MALQLSLDSVLAPPLPIRRFTVEQYHQLGELGVLTPDDQVELLEGWIVEKMSQRPVHGYLVGLLSEFFQRQLPVGWCLRCQLPITAERSEPEPDLAIVQGSHGDYLHQHPMGAQCRLLVEVADSSLEKDRAKMAIYRDAGVQEYWIVNIAEKCVERFCFDAATDDLLIETVATGELLASIGESALTVDFREIFKTVTDAR